MTAAAIGSLPATYPVPVLDRPASPLFLIHYAGADDTLYLRSMFDEVQAEAWRRLGVRGAVRGALAPVGGGPTPGPVLSCAILVVLYTERYLRDDACLREWSLFRERVRRHTRLTGRSTPALIGVRWSLAPGSEDGTIVARDVLHGDFGPCYAAGGGLRLARRDPTSAGRTRLIRRIGELLVAAAADPPPPIPEPSVRYLRLPPAPGSPGPATSPPPPPPLVSPPLVSPPSPPPLVSPPPAATLPVLTSPQAAAAAEAGIGLVVLAANQADLPAERTAAGHYGPGALDWRPFLPADPRPAVAVAREALARGGLPVAEALPLEPETLNRLDAASRERILLLLVDPWAVRSAHGADLLRRYGDWSATRPTVAGALFVLPPGDAQTSRAAADLRDRLRAVLQPRPWPTAPERLVGEVGTSAALARQALRLATRTRNTLLAPDVAGSAGGYPAPGGRVAGGRP